MKFTIFLIAFCLMAVAYADDTTVLKEFSEVNPEDFKYEYELSNQIHAMQEGKLQEKDTWVVKGSYEYVSKEGKHIKVTYVADEMGYHPKVEQ